MTDYASSIQAVALRLCKLDADGSPMSGAKASYVTSKFTRVSFTPEYEVGDEIKQKAADGTTCVYYKMKDTITKVNLEIAICDPQPEAYEFLAGGDLFMDTTSRTVSNKALTSNVATITTSAAHGFSPGNSVVVAGVDSTFNGTFTIIATPTTTTFTYAKTAANVTSASATGTAVSATGPDAIGWGGPESGDAVGGNGLGVEVFTNAIVDGRPAAVNPFFKWLFPLTSTRMDGERALENGLMANAFVGESIGNTAFGQGPALDWLQTSKSAVQFVRTGSAPVGINDYVAVV